MTMTPDMLVEREVIRCISSLVYDLAKGYGEAKGDLGELCEEAFELCTPTLDWEEAAIQEGWTEQDDSTWIKLLPGLEPDQCTTVDTAEEACEEDRLDPYESEIFEHWLVSHWLGSKLAERGHRVGELSGMTVWGRPTTGQQISADYVIEQICAEINAA